MKTKLLIVLSLTIALKVYADSATWNLNPISNDWNTAANWTPATVPNGPTDVATFDVSNLADISISDDTIVDSVLFGSSANVFTITASPHHILIIDGVGIVNSSAETQTFGTSVDGLGDYSRIEFTGNATITGPVLLNNEGGIISGARGGETRFEGFSSAGGAIIMNSGPRADDAGGGHTFFHHYSTAANATVTNLSGVGFAPGYTAFFNHASADHGTFTNEGPEALVNFYGSSTAADATFFNNDGGGTQFVGDHSTAANGTFINNGGAPGGDGGFTIFYNGSDAGNGTFLANPGVNGGEGGTIGFRFDSTGGTARIMIYGNATLDLAEHKGTLTVGSLEGDGNVMLSGHNLSIGSNDLSTTFSGLIESIFSGGSLNKIGDGTFTLSGASTYTGGSILSGGVLNIDNETGSATGTGPVQVNAGTLGGSGIVAGAVTVGTNTGTQAFLAPSKGVKQPATLTIQGALTLNDDSTYIYKLKTKHAKADEVIANGVTIDNGAKFSFLPTGTTALTVGQVFTVISNTAATPISGTFDNLSDGQILTVNGNNFQADYQGGDGNDLTLTVVP
jgi:autotransporter-associated beta strand protein